MTIAPELGPRSPSVGNSSVLGPAGLIAEVMQHIMKMIKTPPSIVLGTLSLTAVLMMSNGCMSATAIYNARGYTGEIVHVSKGDKLFKHNGEQYAIQYPKGKETSNLSSPDIPPGTTVFAYKPRPAYYLLLPLTIPADVVTGPWQIFVFLAVKIGHPC